MTRKEKIRYHIREARRIIDETKKQQLDEGLSEWFDSLLSSFGFKQTSSSNGLPAYFTHRDDHKIIFTRCNDDDLYVQVYEDSPFGNRKPVSAFVIDGTKRMVNAVLSWPIRVLRDGGNDNSGPVS